MSRLRILETTIYEAATSINGLDRDNWKLLLEKRREPCELLAWEPDNPPARMNPRSAHRRRTALLTPGAPSVGRRAAIDAAGLSIGGNELPRPNFILEPYDMLCKASASPA